MQEELIQEFKNGNKQAGDDYYNVNKELIKYATYKNRNMLSDSDEILALVNQAFAYSMLKYDPEKGAFSTLFMITARGFILRHKRDFTNTIRVKRLDYAAGKKIIFCDSLDYVIHASDTENITVAHTLGVEDDFTEVFAEDALNKLSKKDRQALKLYYQHGYSQREVAEMIGSSQSRVSRSIARSKAKLKEILKEAS